DAAAAPNPVTITNVSITSITVTYGTVSGSSGYELDASSTNFTDGVVYSSVTLSPQSSVLSVLSLSPDTTYWLKVGSLSNGATSYANAQSTSTLTNLLAPSTLGVTSNTVTAAWPAFSVGSGTNTAQGYRLEAYSDNGYVSLIQSTATTDATFSTLTLSGLS